MIYKKAIFIHGDVEPLNVPNLPSFIKEQGISLNKNIIVDTIHQIKTASKQADITINSDSPEFDLKAEIENHPDSLFVKCFAIKADEMNDNGDYFPRDELKKSVATFVGVPIFTNHENNDINKARGKVIHSWWDDERDGITIIARVDAAAYPTLARGIREKYVMGTSMGCNVKHSVCSICHNYAEEAGQFCSHIKERKTRTIEAKNQKCEYHKNGKEEKCPICGCEKGENKKYAVNQKVFEYNYGIKFIENSFVVNPACHSCGVTEVIDPQKFLAKISSIENCLPYLLKSATNASLICDDKQCIPVVTIKQASSSQDALGFLREFGKQINNIDKALQCVDSLKKLAGQKEIDNLNQALSMLSTVSESMLKQRAQIDLEFLSDLVQVLADLQTVTDELTEQGYGRLPSPAGSTTVENTPTATPTSAPSTPTDVTQSVGQSPVNPTPVGTSNVTTGPAGSVGTVTSPTAAKKLDLSKMGFKRPIGKININFQIPPKKI